MWRTDAPGNVTMDTHTELELIKLGNLMLIWAAVFFWTMWPWSKLRCRWVTGHDDVLLNVYDAPDPSTRLRRLCMRCNRVEIVR